MKITVDWLIRRAAVLLEEKTVFYGWKLNWAVKSVFLLFLEH